ncbi:DUF4402 domain-containing protein [Salinispirillum sp. LH 10-3-1]|uniref:DUF4402 domain-containing protein n=1 Tax=Salinispirillum sp. LH 10-3-1 TaxID=2952525 RepID=A0AB38YDT7_9GAMM
MRRNSSLVQVFSGALLWLSVAFTAQAQIAITNQQDLAFGRFVAGNGGTVTVGVAGARSSTGDVFLIPSSDGLAAQFLVTGDADATYTIQLPANGAVNLTGPGADMPLSDFVSSPANFGQLSAVGAQTLAVGATLTVNSGQLPGDYVGGFSVIVEYE